MQICELNGICDEGEDHYHCPSDCPEEPEETTTTTTTTTTAPPTTTTTISDGAGLTTATTTTTLPDGTPTTITLPSVFKSITSMSVAALESVSVYHLHILAALLATLLTVFRFKVLPKLV